MENEQADAGRDGGTRLIHTLPYVMTIQQNASRAMFRLQPPPPQKKTKGDKKKKKQGEKNNTVKRTERTKKKQYEKERQVQTKMKNEKTLKKKTKLTAIKKILPGSTVLILLL